MGKAMTEITQANVVQRFADPQFDFVSRFSRHLEGKGNIFRYGHMWKKRIRLKYGMDRPFFRQCSHHILAIQQYLPRIQQIKSRYHS